MVMKRNAMRKNLLQSIVKSFGRYIAIVAIIALGASMFVGLLMTKTDMVATGQKFMDEQNMFDLRLVSPNEEPVLNTAEIHTMEHLAATYLRNEPQWKDRVIYFGPMGCRTGFSLLLAGELTSQEVVPLVRDCFRFIRDFRGEVPGASAKDCGNYLDMNLPMANYWGAKYAALLETITPDRLVYPE